MPGKVNIYKLNTYKSVFSRVSRSTVETDRDLRASDRYCTRIGHSARRQLTTTLHREVSSSEDGVYDAGGEERLGYLQLGQVASRVGGGAAGRARAEGVGVPLRGPGHGPARRAQPAPQRARHALALLLAPAALAQLAPGAPRQPQPQDPRQPARAPAARQVPQQVGRQVEEGVGPGRPSLRRAHVMS